MSKMRPTKKPKRRSKKDASPIIYDRRPVTSDDHWCLFLNRGEPAAPNGYVVSMALPVKSITLNNLGGYIIRSRKLHNNLLLQVVKIQDQDVEYTINYFRIEFGAKVNGGKKRIVYRHIITITSTRGSKQTRRRIKRREKELENNR